LKKSELVSQLAAKAGMTKKDTEKALQAFTDAITEELCRRGGGKVTLVGFGAFDVADREAREGRNPQTGKSMAIPASKAVRFRVGKTLKDAVNAKK